MIAACQCGKMAYRPAHLFVGFSREELTRESNQSLKIIRENNAYWKKHKRPLWEMTHEGQTTTLTRLSDAELVAGILKHTRPVAEDRFID
jgi:hypothetical protein